MLRFTNKVNSICILQLCVMLSTFLVISVYFIYRTKMWPFGIEAAECLLSIVILSSASLFLWIIEKRKVFSGLQIKTVSIGLYIGILWTFEIGMNNIIHPALPLRDNLDDVFWAIIALLILLSTCYSAYKTNEISTGIKDGFWNGLASGAIACLTALLLIVFGMTLIMHDPVNILEWANQKPIYEFQGMAVYFAYQTLAGALMHLVILGVIMGLLLGIIGGLIGKTLNILRK